MALFWLIYVQDQKNIDCKIRMLNKSMIYTIITALAPFVPFFIFVWYWKCQSKIEYLQLQLRLCRELISLDLKANNKKEKEDKNV